IDTIDEGTYSVDKKREDAIHYRLGHTLAETLIEKGKKLNTPTAKINFNYSSSNLNYAELDKLKSKKGVLKVANLAMHSEAEDLDLIVFAGPIHSNEVLKDEICPFLLTLPSTLEYEIEEVNNSIIEKYYAIQKQKHLEFVKLPDT